MNAAAPDHADLPHCPLRPKQERPDEFRGGVVLVPAFMSKAVLMAWTGVCCERRCKVLGTAIRTESERSPSPTNKRTGRGARSVRREY
jgi:hypothetical protein